MKIRPHSPLPAKSGPGRRLDEETEQAVGRRIIREELARHGWKERELARRAKGDRVKVAIAKRLRAETALTLEEIAHSLHMGVPSHVAHLLYHQRVARA